MAEPIQTLHAYHTFGEAIRPQFEEAFPGRELVVWTRPEQLVEGMGQVEALLVLRPPRGHWAEARRLRLLQTTGAGVDAVLPAPDLPAQVEIANARGIHGPQMAEFALAMILAFAKRIPLALEQQGKREWSLYGPRRVQGKTLGILGLGAIGAAVAQAASALGLRVIGTQRSPSPVTGVSQVLPPEETERVLSESDFVVVVLPLTDETRGLLDARKLAAMKPGAILVNMARGGIVDEVALAEALREGRIGGAALDVFDQEPLPERSPLWDTPNTILTPHVAGLSADYMQRVAEIFFENVRRLERGEPLHNRIDRSRGY